MNGKLFILHKCIACIRIKIKCQLEKIEEQFSKNDGWLLTEVQSLHSIFQCGASRPFLLRYKTPHSQSDNNCQTPNQTFRTSPQSPVTQTPEL